MRALLGRRCLATVVFVSGAGACGGIADGQVSADDLGAAEQPIINGTPLSNADAAKSGVVYSETSCSATMLDARWVLLAAHCFPAADDADGNGVIDNVHQPRYAVKFGNASDATRAERWADYVIRHPNGVFGSGTGVDIALMHLSADAPLSGLPVNHFTNGRMALYGGDAASLTGGELTLMGYGKNVPGYGPPWTGVGTLRKGKLPVYYSSLQTFSYYSPSADYLTCNGDSGGPSFLDVSAGSVLRARFLVGVHSTSDCLSYSTDAAAWAFRDWVTSTAWGAPPASISCVGQSCASTPQPLPNSIAVSQSFVPWGAAPDQCYHVNASYNLELLNDWAYFGGVYGGDRQTSVGTWKSHWCGALPVALTTNGSVQSQSLSLTATNHTIAYGGPPPGPGQCAATPGQWAGCRGNGCAVCNEKVRNYPRYFTNHPNCAPNIACGGKFYTCNVNCPAPTSWDQ